MAYQDDPLYQRAVQKLNSLPPHIRAIFSTSGLDAQFAAKDMEKQLMLSKMGTAKRFGQQEYDLAKKQYRFGKQQAQTANLLAALGLPISAASGYMNLQRKQEMANYLRTLAGTPRPMAAPVDYSNSLWRMMERGET